MKVLLLNPPGSRRYLRDYYCSHVSKGNYVWHPIDLLVLSGHLVKSHDVIVIDAIAENLRSETVLQQIKAYQPDVIIFLTGSVSWSEDREFINLISKKNTRLFGIGDISLFQPRKTLSSFPSLDGLLFDFISDAVLSMVDGAASSSGNGYIFRDNLLDKKIVPFPLKERLNKGIEVYKIPRPHYDLFSMNKYHLAHLKYHPFASVLTDFGCPFQCSFCPYERIPYFIREQENLFQELSFLKNRGIREIWFKDQSFGANRAHTRKILTRIIEEKFSFSWSCETRAEFLDKETVSLFKASGCHTVMIGVESSSQHIRKQYKKDISTELIKKSINNCHKAGIKVLTHFIIGLPGETQDSLKAIPDFAISLKSDYATFNIATPEYGTSMRDEAIEHNWIDKTNRDLDSSCSFPILSTEKFSSELIWKIRQKSLIRFYLRSGYILHYILKLKTIYQWRNFIKEGSSLLFELIHSFFETKSKENE